MAAKQPMRNWYTPDFMAPAMLMERNEDSITRISARRCFMAFRLALKTHELP
jgi:hypothetical protein